MKLSVSEVLKKVSEASDDNERVSILHANHSPALIAVIRGIFDPNIVWLLPEGTPPYKPSDIPGLHHMLHSEHRKFYLFAEGGHPNLKQVRREYLFIEFLETLDPEDAKLMISVKDKVMPYPNIDIKLIHKAYPGMIM